MTKLSVNVNKIATIRNARGGNNPDLKKVVLDCQEFGADGITVHPRPDERHITLQDVLDIRPLVKTEYNIEGYPNHRYMDIIKNLKPEQATLVPDRPDVLTSNAGWDTLKNKDFLKEVVYELKSYNSRVSMFVGADPKMVDGAKEVGADRVEFYTEPYALQYDKDREMAIAPYILAANEALILGLGVNAGHDLNMNNLRFLKDRLPMLHEVSIGHALICDALYYGLENVIPMYKRRLA